MFGSVLYRRAAIEDIHPRIEEMGTLCDRPFLLDILERWSGAVVREPLAFCRQHRPEDNQHASLTEDQVHRFFRAYRAALPERLSREDSALFYRYSDHWLRELHRLIPAARRQSLRSLLARAWWHGTYDPLPLGLYGIKRFSRSLLQ